MTMHEDLLLIMAGTAITTIGALSLWAHFASSLGQTRILLWFGLFAAPYGIALICRSTLLPAHDGGADWVFIVLAKLIGLLSGIPALFLFEEFYGKGWRLSSRWLIWMYAVLVVAVVALMAAHDRPRSIPSPGIALVILVPLTLLVNHLAGYRPPNIKNRAAIFAGLVVFFLTFSFDHLAHWRAADEMETTEPVGFIFLTLCLGRVVSGRVADNEGELLSMAGEMSAARKIQAALLPASMPTVTGYSIAARYAPMAAVAGDFYGFPTVQPDSLSLFLGDVMGHGVPAAIIASMMKVSVFASAQQKRSPGEIMGDLNGTLCKDAQGQYATGVYLSLDRERKTGSYCAAGHPPPLLWRRKLQKIEALKAEGLLLGVRPTEAYESTTFTFESGDRLLVYSDGLTEAENLAGASFGEAKLPALISSGAEMMAEEFATKAFAEVLAWSTYHSVSGQADDITFVVIDAI